MTVARVQPGNRQHLWSVLVPGSKSITNRVLLLAGVAEGTSCIANALLADDTHVVARALEALGADITASPEGDGWTVQGLGGPPIAVERPRQVWCGMAGTAARFVPPMCAAGRGRFDFDADPQLCDRPLGPLMTALVAQGASLEPAHATTLPATVHAAGLAGGRVEVDSSESSQFLSGLLLAAPFARAQSSFDATLPVSRPYLAVTIEAMRAFGVRSLSSRLRRSVCEFSVQRPPRAWAC